MKRPWPRSLAGQLAAVIALALFVAQAINFSLILRDRTRFRLAQATRPVATWIADALEREASMGRPLRPDRGRVRRATADPVRAGTGQDFARVAAELGEQLTEQGVAFRRIDAGLVSPADQRIWPSRWRERDADGRPVQLLMLAVEQPRGGWLTTVVPWPTPGTRLLFALLTQTLILYAVLLLPVLLIVRRLARPLRDLTAAAERFGPGDAGTPVPVRGPADIAGLVGSFNALRLRVTAMLAEKDRMLGAIGHDLRTPLAALRVRIESVEDDTDRARMADTVEEMSRTLDDILSLARLGRPSEPLTEVDVAALVDAVVEDFRDLGQDVTFAETERLPMRLRPALIRRAVRNLVENAVKYARAARVRVEPGVASVTIVISDDGPGIPPDRLAEVFEPFTRLETSRNRETGGIGLGLALARAIVREAGGDLSLTNRAGGGLDATITLPRN